MPWQTIRDLRRDVAEMQHSMDILLGDSVSLTTNGNPYPDYESQVAEVAKKYEGKAEWGCQVCKSIVDMRTAFILGQGVQPDGPESAAREIEFIQAFMQRNDLDETAQDWVREAEIEGKFLCRLTVDKTARQIDARFVPWTQHKYTVETHPTDYAQYTGVHYMLNKTGAEVQLTPREFVYTKFGGRVHLVNESAPKVASVLKNMESMEKALTNWRAINSFFASPTPYFKVESNEEGTALSKALKAMSWKIGKFLIGTAEFTMVGAPMDGVQSLKDELTSNAQIVSGNTGVPIQLLGFPELLSNRSTSENMMESVYASTSRDRVLWKGTFTELFQKVLALANEQLNGGFNDQAVTALIPETTAAKLEELNSVWLPLYQQGALSLETMLSKVPDINVEEEMARIEEAQAARVREASKEMFGEGDDA